MSVVKINAVEVPEGMGSEFIERFAKRAGSVEDQPGFEEFLLLRPTDEHRRFFVFTRWESDEAFQAWLQSSDFAAAHAHVAEDAQAMAERHAPGATGGHHAGTPAGRGHGHGGPVAINAELLAFEVMERVTRD
ncbi:MAG: antibiotic biosynthesis monooxygenase [Actinomycetota bacterium]